MRILITGASGYIGKRLVAAALQNKHEVIAATRRPVAAAQDWIPFDLSKLAEFHSPENIDAIVHLAADTSSSTKSGNNEICIARQLAESANNANARFVFVSSQTASEHAPTQYGRTKWLIEQDVLKHRGIVVRLGQVYGGQEEGLFGDLTTLVRRLPVLPNFVPSVWIQPIHIDDCVEGVMRLLEAGSVEARIYSLASPDPVSFTDFLRAIARYRVRRYRLFLPVPVRLVRLISGSIGRKLGEKTGFYRLNSLLSLPAMETADDVRSIGLALRSLDSGVTRCGGDQRRRLLQEGRALLSYVLKERPQTALTRRYVRLIEQLQSGAPLPVRPILYRLPFLIALLDSQSDNRSPKEDQFRWRLDAAALIAEASEQGAVRFLGPPESFRRSTAVLRIIAAVFAELFWRMVRFLTPSSLIRIP